MNELSIDVEVVFVSGENVVPGIVQQVHEEPVGQFPLLVPLLVDVGVDLA